MDEIKNSDILFITPTFGTRWLFYQQYLIEHFFPGSKRVLVDGNMNWDFEKGLKCLWYDFTRIALKNKNRFKYFIHIDEDCFITNGQGIIEAIRLLETGNFDLVGPADVIPRIRNFNPKALNSFFMIGKIKSLERVMAGYEIDLSFDEINEQLNIPIEEFRKEYEPYYDFFWNYYKKGFAIGNINTSFDDNLKCTGLLARNGQIFGYHMWFTRTWKVNEDILGCGATSYQRYMNMGKFLQKKFNISSFDLFNALPYDLKGKYLSITYSKLVRKPVRRAVSELRKKAALRTRFSKLVHISKKTLPAGKEK
jgi:hypothetical protein